MARAQCHRVTPTTTPPGPVSNFVASLGATSVAFFFDVAEPVGPGSLSRPHRAQGGQCAGWDCTGQSATDSRPADGVTYHYAAYAYDQSGNASSVARAQVTVAANDVYTSFVTDSGCAACSAAMVGGELRAAIGGAGNSVDTAYGVRDFGGATGLPGRLYTRTVLRLPAGQTLASDLWIFSLRDAANRVIYEIYLTSGRVIRLSSPAGGLRSASISSPTGITLPNDGVTTRRVEVSSLANNSVEVRVDGVTRISITGLTGATTSNPRYLRAGIDRYDGSNTRAVQLFQSRVSFGQTTWLGP